MQDIILAIINKFPMDGYRTYIACLSLAIAWTIYGVVTGDYMSAISVVLGSLAIIFKRKAVSNVSDQQKEIKDMLTTLTTKIQDGIK